MRGARAALCLCSSALAFAPGFSEVAAGFLFFLVSLGPAFVPTARAHSF